MSTLSEAKALGGVGSILVLLVPIPTAGPVLGVIGFIMTLIAFKYIADAVKDPQIYSNMIYSVLLDIVAIAVAAIAVIGAIYQIVSLAMALTVIGGLVAVWILLIVASVFLRRSCNAIASKLDIHLFSTAGLIFFIGAVTSVILVGFLLILVAEVILAVSFFSIRETTAMTPQSPDQNLPGGAP